MVIFPQLCWIRKIPMEISICWWFPADLGLARGMGSRTLAPGPWSGLTTSMEIVLTRPWAAKWRVSCHGLTKRWTMDEHAVKWCEMEETGHKPWDNIILLKHWKRTIFSLVILAMYLLKKHDSHGNLCWFTRRHITTFQWCQGQTQVTENEISPVLAFNQEKHPGFASSFWLRLVRHQWILDSGMSWHKKSVYVQSKLLLPSHRKPRFCSSKFGSSCESVLANSAATRFGSGGWQNPGFFRQQKDGKFDQPTLQVSGRGLEILPGDSRARTLQYTGGGVQSQVWTKCSWRTRETQQN